MHNGPMRRLVHALTLPIVVALLVAAPASAKLPVLKPSSYPGMTTFNCRTDPITLNSGQNLNKYSLTKACPHAEVVSGPLDASVFEAGSGATGYMTRFKPSMVELHDDGSTTLPPVWDLHLHHVVWLPPNGGVLAAGEEKTIATLPQGYGIPLDATANWGLVAMLHNLTPIPDRQVYLTWQIDWVPQTDPARTDISPMHGTFMDVANGGAYPVFDAQRSFDEDGNGKFTFPKEVSTDPADPSYEELGKVSPSRSWTVPSSYTDGITLLSAGGHLHPGGLHVDLQVARDGPDDGTTDGDDPSEVKPLFRSDAHYYEPAGAVSWDVAMTVARRDWRIHLEPGDTVSIDATYNVSRASWYESMGILSLGWTPNADPNARDPFVDAAAVRSMYREGGALTHRRLPENADTEARDDLNLPDPRKLPAGGPAPSGGIDVANFLYQNGGFSALSGFPGRTDEAARHPARRHHELHQPGCALRPAPGRAGLAHDHRLPSSLQQGLGDRLPARQRPGRLRLRGARIRQRHQLQRHDRHQRVHDAAVVRLRWENREGHQARRDVHVLLPPPSLHAGLLPRPRAGRLRLTPGLQGEATDSASAAPLTRAAIHWTVGDNTL